MKSKIKTPHDTLFRKYYANVGAVAEFLEHNLPEDVAGHIDFQTLSASSESFVSDELRTFFADRVYECRLRDGRDASIYILLEHKSAPAPVCAVQVLRYMVMLWEDAAINGLAQELPVVIPLVVYHGKRTWTGRQLRDLFPQGPLDRFIPGYEMMVFDLSTIPESEIKGSLAGKAVLLFLKALQERQPDAKLAELFRLLMSALGPDSAMKTINIFLRYIHEVREDITPQRIFEALAQLPEGEKVMRNVAAEYSPDAYRQGVEKGVEKGIDKGIEKGVRDALLSILSSRFGVLRPAINAKLARITDPTTLTSLAPSAASVESLQEFERVLDSVLEDIGN
jgi:predicted transposase/invertase (TIGR01784 family)